VDKNFNRLMTKSKTKGTSYADPMLYFVQWTDAVTDNGWEVGTGTSDIDVVSSIGYLIYKDKDKIILAGDVSYDKDKLVHTNRRISIPNKWILFMKEMLA